MQRTKSAVCLLITAAAVSLPDPARAQEVASSFATLAGTLQPGRTVIVETRTDGRTKGEVLEISDSTLTLRVRDKWGSASRRQLDESNLTTIRRTDSHWNGLFIGLGAGIVAAESWRRIECGPRGFDDECSAIVFGIGVFTMVPGGAVIGALVDKYTGNRLVYQAPARTMVSVAPTLGRGRGGLAVSIRF